MNKLIRIGLLIAANLLVFGAGWLAQQRRIEEQRWQGALYCFEAQDMVWGLATIPQGVQPECPSSSSYRQEIRQGLGRTEQFRLAGWQPVALLDIFTAAGYSQQTSDLSSNDYAAFLQKVNTDSIERLQYNAVRQGQSTLITISGPAN